MSAQQTPHVTAGDVAAIPPSFGYNYLSILLGKSVASLQSDRCRRPWALPPAGSIPGSKSPVWLLSDVLAWLAAHREPAVQRPSAPDPVEPEPPRRGRPTKREQIERQRAAAARQGGAA